MGLFVPRATVAQAKEIQEAVLLPEGSLVFTLDGAELAREPGSVLIIQIPSGATLLRVVRDESQRLVFDHTSPGTGTRTAEIPMPTSGGERSLLITLTWSEASVNLYAGFRGGEIVSAMGTQSAARERVTPGGTFRIGDEGIEVAGYQVWQGGRMILRESAIEAWDSTRMAIELHMRGTTVEGYIGEVVQANLALVMMATGLETFADRRFRELPEEGRRADVEACAAAVLPKNLRATREYNTLSEVLEARTVDFGNYEQAKAAYRAAYGLRFGDDLGVPSGTLEQVKRMLRYRNRIAHVSPMIGFLNQPWVPPEEPEMSGRPLAEAYLAAISAFVQALHQSTLRLR